MARDHEKLPISAIIPVLNCAHRMREHMEKSMEWMREVSEVIVVDSHSKDGTVDIIQEFADELNLKVFTYPVGLYASWNKGVSEASKPFIYFSTVGDYISLKGLKQLLRSIRKFRADVIISPPEFTFESQEIDERAGNISWPIHDIIKDLKLTEPSLMEPWVLYDYVMVYLEQCILGSSASNLYRRSILLDYPFSDDFYSAGDSAWIIEHNFDAQIAIHPEAVSTYLFHTKDWAHEGTHQTRGPILRRKFAYRAYHKSLEHATWLDPEIAKAARETMDLQKMDTTETIRDTSMSFLTNTINEQAHQVHHMLDKMTMIQLEVAYLGLKQKEAEYRARMRALRLLWPPAAIIRLKRKSIGRQMAKLAKNLRDHSP